MTASAVLDTHILVWWRSDPGRLTATQRDLLDRIESSGEPFRVSAITIWELGKLVERGHLAIQRPLDLWLSEIEQHPRLEVVPVTARIVAESCLLQKDGFHKDRADQLIAATARCLGLPLVTLDERIRAWGKVRVV